MNNEQLERLGQVISKDSYLYQLAQKDALESLETSDSDILDPETMQERADEFRKDDSEPDFLDNAKACNITEPDCEACQ
jgi:hypothetical protein